MTDDTTKQLLELRDHHARELQRIDDALALLKQVGKLARKATKTVAKVRQQASGTTRKRKRERFPVFEIVREVFRGAGHRTISRDEILDLSGLKRASASDLGGRAGGIEGKATRVLGMALAGLIRRKEIKETRGGYVARAIAAPSTAGRNGHAAP